jgi:uncharacterized protein YggT (Ycf19 family)
MDSDTQLWILRIGKAIVVFIYAVVMVGLVLLTLGFVLQLFGASTSADFTEWVYRSVDRIMEPFRGMFPSQQRGERSIVDFSMLFAMIVYAILALALHALVSWLAASVVKVRREQQRASAQVAQVADGQAMPQPGQFSRGH